MLKRIWGWLTSLALAILTTRRPAPAGDLVEAELGGTLPAFRLPHGVAPPSPANGDVWQLPADLPAVDISGEFATIGPAPEDSSVPQPAQHPDEMLARLWLAKESLGTHVKMGRGAGEAWSPCHAEVARTYGLATPRAYITAFGSMPAARARAAREGALLAAGLLAQDAHPTPRPRRRADPKQLLHAAYQFKLATGDYPKQDHGTNNWRADQLLVAKRLGVKSPNCYRTHFGTVAKAWEQAERRATRSAPTP